MQIIMIAKKNVGKRNSQFDKRKESILELISVTKSVFSTNWFLTKLPGARIISTLPSNVKSAPSNKKKGTFFFFMKRKTIAKTVSTKQQGPMFSVLQPAIRESGMIQMYLRISAIFVFLCRKNNPYHLDTQEVSSMR